MGKRSLPVSDAMPSHRKRRRSINEAGHAHALTFSCVHRLPLLSKDRTRQWFIDALARAREQWRFQLWAYVIMPEHAHILLLPNDDVYSISEVLKSIKQPVARRATEFLRRNAPEWLERLRVSWPDGRIEHRFWQQGGGYDRNIVSSNAAWASVNYLHMNPVRRGLVETPEEWTWSSARYYAGVTDVPIAMDGAPPDP